MLNLKSDAGSFLWPVVVLLLGLALTGAAWRYASATGDEKSLAEFNLHARDTARDVQSRIEVYFGVLRSAGGFFAGSNSVILLAGSLLSIGASSFTFLRNRQKQLIQHHAYHDHLTGLPNRLLLHDRFQQALANAQRHGTEMALLFLDLDNFKPVNDTLGHAVGDKVLKAVATCFASCLREGDTLSRVGGDEFVILLLNIARKEEASAVAQKILEAISKLCVAPVDEKDIHLGGSIGISMFPQDGASFEDLLRNADAAMYRAKEAGRNNFQFYASQMI